MLRNITKSPLGFKRKRHFILWSVFVLTTALCARSLIPAQASFLSGLEQSIVEELNLARTQPQIYARFLEEHRTHFQGKNIVRPGKVTIATNEGTRAVDEAIRALKNQKPLPAMTISKGMSQAAKDHVKDTGPRGITGHSSSNGKSPFDRINRYGKWLHTAGENISYGYNDARSVIIQLLVDDGVPGRGHRKNLLSTAFNVVGVACGPHKAYRFMCVQDFAGGYQEK